MNSSQGRPCPLSFRIRGRELGLDPGKFVPCRGAKAPRDSQNKELHHVRLIRAIRCDCCPTGVNSKKQNRLFTRISKTIVININGARVGTSHKQNMSVSTRYKDTKATYPLYPYSHAFLGWSFDRTISGIHFLVMVSMNEPI